VLDRYSIPGRDTKHLHGILTVSGNTVTRVLPLLLLLLLVVVTMVVVVVVVLVFVLMVAVVVVAAVVVVVGRLLMKRGSPCGPRVNPKPTCA
jgi:hypothetical protein